MDYKRVFRTRAIRRKILSYLTFVPDSMMLRIQYYLKLGRKLNLKNPKRFTEKLQWYKLHYRNPLMKQCVNKFTVREYVKEKGLESILVKLYGHYDNVDSIVWDDLPDEFVIKTQHGGGGLSVLLCHNKSEKTKARIRKELAILRKETPSKRGGREWAYWGIPTGIVAEELLINREKPEAGINDYKIFCYNGHAKYIIVDVDRYIGHKRNFYDRDWNDLHVTSDCPASDRDIPKPDNLDEMLRVAEKLSEDFPYVRVDLYSVDGKVYFGELTFYPWSGYVQYTPDEWDYTFGELFELRKFE